MYAECLNKRMFCSVLLKKQKYMLYYILYMTEIRIECQPKKKKKTYLETYYLKMT